MRQYFAGKKRAFEIPAKREDPFIAQCTPFVQNAEGPFGSHFLPGIHTLFPQFLWISRGGTAWETYLSTNLLLRFTALVDFAGFGQVPATALNEYVKTGMVFQVKGELVSNHDSQLALIIGYEVSRKIGQAGDPFFIVDNHNLLKELQFVGNLKQLFSSFDKGAFALEFVDQFPNQLAHKNLVMRGLLLERPTDLSEEEPALQW
jgi:hypothetical protein